MAEFFKKERLEFLILVLTHSPVSTSNFKVTLLKGFNQNNTLKKM
jgi:hypothetical protein